MSAQPSASAPSNSYAPTARNSASDFAAAMLAVLKVTDIDTATLPLFLALMDVAAGRATPFQTADRYIGQRLARRSGVAVEMEQGSDSDRARAKRFLTAWKLADAEQHRTGHRLAERRRGGLRGEDREKMRRVASTYTVPLVEIVPEVIRRARSSRAFYGPRRAEMYEQAARDVLSERPQDYQSEAATVTIPGDRGSKGTKRNSTEPDATTTREMKAHARIVQAAVEKIKRFHLAEPDADALRHALHQQIEDYFAPLFADADPGEVASGVYYSVSGKVLHADDEPASEPEFPPFDLSESDFSDESDAPAEPNADVRANYTSVFTKANVYAGENKSYGPSACIVVPPEPTPKTTSEPTLSESLNLLTQALVYASFGWHVFPLHTPVGDGCSCRKADCSNIGKHPLAHLAPRGFKDATTDPETIKAWWAKAPFANIGIATGNVSDLLAVDVDPKHDGWEGLRALLERLGEPFPATVEAITGSNGRHFLFRMPEADIRNSAGKLGAGLDVRANGGYIVAAPSLHRSGNRYQWASDEATLEHVPYKLVQELTEPERSKRGAATSTGFTPRAAWTCGAIAEGGRNDTLFRRAAAMRGAGASEDEILDALYDLNNSCSPPLNVRELSKIAASAATYATNGRHIA